MTNAEGVSEVTYVSLFKGVYILHRFIEKHWQYVDINMIDDEILFIKHMSDIQCN